jgi:ribose transport system permease protein
MRDLREVASRIPERGKPRQLSLPPMAHEIMALFALVIIAIVLSFASPYFFTSRNILNVGRQASINLIIALGMTVVIISAGIDLSVGSLAALAAVAMDQVWLNGYVSNIWVSAAIAILIVTLCGTINGLIIHFGNVPPFVATLGMMGIARGSALILTRGYTTVHGFPKDFQWIGAGYVLGIPFPFLFALSLTVIFYLMLRFSELGRSFYAIGGNEEAARLSGVLIGRIKIAAYTISGLASAIAGIVLASRTNSAPPAAGTGYELNAIAAVVIGGTGLFGGEGTVYGTLIGALLMAVIGNGLNLLNVNPFWQQVVIGSIIILAVLMTNLRRRSR